MNFVFWLLGESRSLYDVFSIMITKTWPMRWEPPCPAKQAAPARPRSPDGRSTAIGPTTAPRPNATATATAQAGKRDIRLTEDQICRVTAYLHVVA